MAPAKPVPVSKSFPTPHVVVSRCLGFDACRYNGERIPDDFVEKLRPHVKFTTVCPEIQIGLGVPRDPIHLELIEGRTRLVQPATGKDVTEDMKGFADSFFSSLQECDGFILKSRSPSCGLRDVKLRRAKGGQSIGRGSGMFGEEVLKRFPACAIEDEARLSNKRIREDFLTRLFLWARFRQVRKSGSMRALIHFHADHKLLLMAYHPKELSLLGNIVANREKQNPAEVIAAYGSRLGTAVSAPPTTGRNVNVLMHAFGYVSNDLKPAERIHFLSALEEYRRRRLPLSALLGIFQSWLARFEPAYLQTQAFFFPFPSELADIQDSGKDRL